MKLINFTKMVASGNDFVIVEDRLHSKISQPKILAKKICHRRYGVGADGLLILKKSKLADIKMRIFNPDGSEAEMCGNGARCVSLWLKSKINPSTTLRIDGERPSTTLEDYVLKFIEGRSRTIKNQKSKILKIETKAGIIESKVSGDNVGIKLTNPKDIKLDMPITVNDRCLKVNFIDTGVPHVVIFTEGLDKIDVINLGRVIRYHKHFAPRGTNVNFIEVLGKDSIKIRTYERGVEDETLACGTGSVASALLFALKTKTSNAIKVHTKSKEILKIYFSKKDKGFGDVWLEGKARVLFKGNFFH